MVKILSLKINIMLDWKFENKSLKNKKFGTNWIK
jgi:hypothetical protein